MKGIHLKKPDIKGTAERVRHLKREDVKAWWKKKKERREEILEKRRNSKFARTMKPVYRFMDRFSIIFQALLACILNFGIEAISRHACSLWRPGGYMTGHRLCFISSFSKCCDVSLPLPKQAKRFCENTAERILAVSWGVQRIYAP